MRCEFPPRPLAGGSWFARYARYLTRFQTGDFALPSGVDHDVEAQRARRIGLRHADPLERALAAVPAGVVS
jgi:hypothetical protein